MQIREELVGYSLDFQAYKHPYGIQVSGTLIGI